VLSTMTLEATVSFLAGDLTLKSEVVLAMSLASEVYKC
jgi:hypothetical protein